MKRLYMLFVAALIIMTLSACSKETVLEIPSDRIAGEVIEYSGSEYVTVGESDNMLLLLQPKTGNIRWQNKATGDYFETKLVDSGITNSSVLSDLIAYYYSGSKQDKYNTSSSMDSYTYGVEMDTMTFEKVEQGVRIVYDISANKVTYKDFPAYISPERMEEFVLQYLDDAQIRAVLKQFRLTNSGVYARITNKDVDKQLSGMAATQLYNFFYEIGNYTYEELIADNEEYDIPEDEYPTKQSIVVAMEYYLSGDDLMVRIPTGEITFSRDFPLKSLDVLPYFLSSNEEDGYIFVPDGSGALIYLDNNKRSEYQFTANYFGGDILQGATVYNSNNIDMTLPVYGIKVGDKATIGIIEKGSEVATLKSYVNGYFSGIPYSRVSLSFAIREDQAVARFTDGSSPYTIRMLSEDSYKEDILIRYCFLSGENANYTGMAKAYQNYLLNTDGLATNKAEDTAPLFVEFLGAIDKEKYFLGIPYKGTEVLTTFEGAKGILSTLNSEGIDNFKVEYNGMVNGGINQRAVNNNVTVESALGGKSGLSSFVSYANSIGAEIFPKIKLQTASTKKNLTKDQRSFTISGTVAQIYKLGIVSGLENTSEEYAEYVINPVYMPDYIQKFLNSYNKLGLKTLASGDFLSFLSANYKKNENLSMTNAIPYYMESLNALARENTLMLSNPIYLAFRNVDYLTDIPTTSSMLKIEDASIPFLQLVLDGYVTYSSQKLNNHSHDLTKEVMKAIETKSALKFTFMEAQTSILQSTRANDIFMADYPTWDGIVSEYYKEYNAFYQKVKDAVIIKHEIIDRNNDFVWVAYSNGVQIYFNYSDDDAIIKGVHVKAFSYVISNDTPVSLLIQ